MVPQKNIGHDHLHGMISKEAPWANDLAVAKVQVVLASGGELYF
jgi:fatty acid desaturase